MSVLSPPSSHSQPPGVFSPIPLHPCSCICHGSPVTAKSKLFLLVSQVPQSGPSHVVQILLSRHQPSTQREAWVVSPQHSTLLSHGLHISRADPAQPAAHLQSRSMAVNLLCKTQLTVSFLANCRAPGHQGDWSACASCQDRLLPISWSSEGFPSNEAHRFFSIPQRAHAHLFAS